MEVPQKPAPAFVPPPAEPLPTADEVFVAPASFAQSRLWFLDRLRPGSPAYNLFTAVRAGGLRPEVFQRALDALVERHESLRTTFSTFQEEPVQVIAPPAPVHMPQVDLRSLPAAAREPEVMRLAAAEALRAFDLVRGPLLRVTLVRLGTDDDAVLFNLHHIVGDGWSMGVLVREVTALYEAFSRGRPSPLPDLQLQYADFAQAQRDWLQGEVLEEQVEWWRRRLAGVEPLELPSDRPRPAVRSFRGRIRAELLPAGLSRALAELGRRGGTSLFVVLLAGLDALLHRYTGSEDVSIGTVVAGRDDVDTEGMIGFFVNTLVLRTDLSGRSSFLELLARAHAVAMDAFAHPSVPFEKLVEELATRRDPARTPFFDGILVLQNTPGETPGGAAPGLSGPTAVKFDWSLNVLEVREGLLLSLEYSTELFDGTTIQRLLAHLRGLLEGAVADPRLPVSALPMLAEAERHQLAAEWNDTGVDGSAPSALALFEAQAARTPEAPAVAFAGESLTYGELDRRAGRLAFRLRGLGAGPEARVGLYLERSVDLLVGILGAWKAGAAWVPLDPAQPDSRLALVVEDAFRGLGAPALVAHQGLRDRLAALPLDGARVVWMEETAGGGETVTTEVAPGDLAYVIYTSGTTGRPKGVLVEHGSLAHSLAGAQRVFGFHEGDSTLCVAPFAFDIFLFDALAPLLAGGSTMLLDPGEGLDLQLAAAALMTVTHFDTVPALMRQIVEEVQGWPRGASSLRHIFSGGDAVPPSLLAGMREAFPGARVTVLYGPTEATVICASHDVDAAAIPPGNMLGRPLPGVRLDVRDRDGQLVPAGIPGELWVGGPGVVRGYLHRPALTAEKFVPQDGRRFYRTGDLARRLADGSLEFLGRIDHQVKVRGFRVEPGEVESVLAAEPEVRAAAVLARQPPGDGELRLAAWVVPRGPEDGRLLPALRERLRARLPEYMVPVDWTLLPELPLTPNGKLDRRALLETLDAGGEALREVPYEAPRTATEELLAGLWAELLGRERVGARDHFFDLGGHSLLATRLVSRMGGLFGVELPLNAVFEAPTLGGLAVRVEAALAAGEGVQAPPMPPMPPIAPVPRTGRIPLSFAQERLWFLDQLDPGRPVYNMPVALRLGGGVQPALLERSLSEVVRRHEALRTTFPAVQGLPYQEIVPPGEVVLPVIDLRGLPAARRLEEARRQLAEEASRPFDLVGGPLLRVLALRLDGGELALSLTLHHIVSDGWSMEVLTAELTALYEAFARGLPSPLPGLPVQYADYAVWQRGWLAGEVLERQVEYWKRKLAGAPMVLELPADRPRPAVQSFRGANRPLAFPPEPTAAVHELGRRHGATLFMTLLAVFQALLHRASGQEVVLVGSPVANRNRTEIEGLIGFFANTLVLAGDLGGEPPFAELLARVRETVLEAQAHQDLPFEKLVEELDPERSLSHSPLFQVMLTLTQSHRRPSVAALAGDAAPGAVETAPGPAKFDLSLALEEREGRLAGSLEYAADLFDAPTVARLGEQLQAALAAVVARPEVRPSELPLLSPEQRQQLLLEWGEVAAAPADPRSLHDLVAEQAARTPEAVAVRCRGEELTYGDLDAQSNRLARLLRGAGAGPEVPVAVFMDRSVEMVVALLGVLKSGAAYVPLDPAYPQERLAFMLEDCGATVLLSQDWLVDRLPAGTGARRVCLDPTFETLEDEGDGPPASPVAPANLAYLIYTSGSTGRPKGVAVTHASAVALLRWAAGAFSGEELAGVLASTSICFDLSVFELFFPLSRGGCVLVVENALEMLAVDREGGLGGQPVTLLNTVPSAASELVRTAGLPASVRTVCLAGEPIPAPLAAQILAQPGVGRLLNLYGPSEDTTYSTAERVELAARGLAASPAIGRPIPGTRAYVLDAGMRLVPPGMPGELYLGGAGLARGYFRRPDLTAGRFVPDPFGELTGLAGERLYRTGDRVRHLADGRLDYLGRFDHQVKLRGFRVELGEIEAVLARHPAVRQAVVTVRGGASDRRLVAYLVPAPAEDGETPQVHEIKGYLRDRLPEYMVPPAFVLLPELPLNPSGKVDRRALPDPGMDARMPPRDLVELELARLWEEVLGVHPVGVRDDFFDLGGHSLLAVRLMASIRERFGRELPLASLFRAATVEQLAALLREGGEPLERRTLVEITAPRPGPAAPPLFCVHPAGGNVLCYMELARALGPDQPVYGLQLTEGAAGGVEEMAARYAAAVREVQPRGPYSLGGWSAGGTIAFEMARQLAATGEEVRLLALIDTPRPGIDGVWQADEIELMVMFARDLAATYGQEMPPTVTSEYLHGIDPGERIPRVLAEAQAIHLFPPGLGRPEAERLFGMFRSVQEAVAVYVPRPYPGPAVVFRASDTRPDLDPAFGWGDFAQVEVEPVEGDHYSIVRAPHVEALARLLAARLREEGR